ncbi:putative Photosystem I biogenesis protein BtpA [Blattamonas nauphoetae]|uniref:Photosystem I biogenesis protein BtpA n=1 Tax=Blattamonas nauphoetae TaxID=2049346 RepID=A0ABQ9XCG7_9EUKA|nr:putative Photosystem I biogenesis protein BtpA [Blattamonas nauphoetae]
MSTTIGNRNLFQRKSLIGMVHVRALPGTPMNSLPIEEIVSIAVKEAKQLEEAGFDMICVENMHDTPYLNRNVGPEIVACMTVVCHAIRQAIKVPFGIQILAGANKEALATAFATGASFIRCEGFVFSTVADEGIMNSDAAELLRYRHAIGADKICIFTDIKKKHSSHSLTSDIDIAEMAKAAHFYRSDGVIVTGISTGQPADENELVAVRKAVPTSQVQVLIGSGITPSNLVHYWDNANAFIVGSYIKEDGDWERPIDMERARAVVAAANALRQ